MLDRVRVHGRTLREVLRRPDVDVPSPVPHTKTSAALALTADGMSEVEAEVKCEGYVDRQAVDVERMRRSRIWSRWCTRCGRSCA